MHPIESASLLAAPYALAFRRCLFKRAASVIFGEAESLDRRRACARFLSRAPERHIMRANSNAVTAMTPKMSSNE